jgi:hypothetical protein
MKPVIPNNKIVCFNDHSGKDEYIKEIVEPLKGKIKRDWFSTHAYQCLPLTIGNQYGFAIKSMLTFSAIWDGTDGIDAIKITIDDANSNFNAQTVSSHFGLGLLTLQNRFSFRTPEGVNLMVLDPPNYFNANLQNMFAVVETDNLRRDFTFNLKIVEPHREVKIKKGDYLSCVIPIPRFYVDSFDIELASDMFDQSVIDEELRQLDIFSHKRNGEDKTKPHAAGKLYWKGYDADGNPFYRHQRTLK